MNQMLQEPQVKSPEVKSSEVKSPETIDPPAPSHPRFAETAAGGLRAIVLAPRGGGGMPDRLPRRDRGAPHHQCRSVRGARLVRNPAARADPRQDAALYRHRRGGAGGRWRHLPPRIRRRHRDQGADGCAAAHRGADLLGGADAAAVPRERRASRFLPPAFRASRASRSRKPAPTRCSAWNGCAARSRRELRETSRAPDAAQRVAMRC